MSCSDAKRVGWCSGGWRVMSRKTGPVYFALILVACGGSTSVTDSSKSGSHSEDAYPGIVESHFALLSSNCTVTATDISVSVNAGETAFVSLVNGNVSVNGTQANGSPCEGAATFTVTINPGTAGDHGVFLDYSVGVFSLATSTSGPKVRLNLGTGGNDTLTVRGTSGVDRYYFGKGTVANTHLLNVNGGSSGGDDSFADVSIVGAEKVVASAGAGNDILDGTGLFGTTAAYPNALSLFGGANDDTLKGGAGSDTLSGDAGNDTLNGGAGNNTFACSATQDGTDIMVVATGAVDTVDYSQRFNTVSVLLNGTAASGEAGENDTIPDTVSVVIGGNGNDSLSAAGSAKKHTLMGGPGNDTLTGGNGNDTLMGGNTVLQVDGDDLFIGSKATVNYSARTQPLTVTMNSAGGGGADANDGDPATTRIVQSATAATPGATITASTNTVTGLSNMNAGSVGRLLVITGSTGGNDNGSYRIASVTNATTVVLNSTDTAANTSWTDDSAATWTFVETAGAEKDEVRCQSIIGSATAANTITGDANDNWITGGTAADTLVGGAGVDMLRGLDAADTLYGGVGDDILIGGPGNDLLHGGDGGDVLEGDLNTDLFECDGGNDASTAGTAPSKSDYVVDFVSAPDNDTRATPNDCEF